MAKYKAEHVGRLDIIKINREPEGPSLLKLLLYAFIALMIFSAIVG